MGPEEESIRKEEGKRENEESEPTKREQFKMALVGIGQGGGNIIDAIMIRSQDGEHKRCRHLKEVIGDRAWAINTGDEIEQLQKTGRIPADNCIRIGTSEEGAGGQPGVGWDIFDEEESTIDGVLRAIDNTDPSVIVIAHSAAGGTGGGGAPYFIKKAIDKFLLGKGDRKRGEMSAYLYIISVLPTDYDGQKLNAIYSVGKIYEIYEEAIEENEDVKNRFLPLLMSNHQFYNALNGIVKKNGDLDQAKLFGIMNPIPTDVLYQVSQSCMRTQKDEVKDLKMSLHPADLKGVSPKRPFATIVMDEMDDSSQGQNKHEELSPVEKMRLRRDTPGIITGLVPKQLNTLVKEFEKEVEMVGWSEAVKLTESTEEELKQVKNKVNSISNHCFTISHKDKGQKIEFENNEIVFLKR